LAVAAEQVVNEIGEHASFNEIIDKLHSNVFCYGQIRGLIFFRQPYQRQLMQPTLTNRHIG